MISSDAPVQVTWRSMPMAFGRSTCGKPNWPPRSWDGLLRVLKTQLLRKKWSSWLKNIWLVVDLPLWKMMEWVRQLGWWLIIPYYSQYDGKIKFMFQTTPTSISYLETHCGTRMESPPTWQTHLSNLLASWGWSRVHIKPVCITPVLNWAFGFAHPRLSF